MIHLFGNKTKTHINGIVDVDVQPNAVDLRLGEVYRLSPDWFIVNEREKIHRSIEKIVPSENNAYDLNVGVYQVAFQNTISVGEDEAGWVITRSTLIRNGVFIVSGLYDSGYSGKMIASMHVTAGPMRIEVGTRIGQFLIYKAEALHSYDGDYGASKNHDKKYT